MPVGALIHNSVCCIFNLAPLYKSAIYKLIDDELKSDFYIGNGVLHQSMKLMQYEELKGFKKTLQNIPLLGNFYWQKRSVPLAFKKQYKQYIITGEPYCISTWLILIINVLLGKKTYLWTHGWYGDENWIKKIIKKIFFGPSTKLLLYGDYARNLMIKEGFNPNKLVCIYNSLDYSHQVTIRKSLSATKIYQNHFGNNFPVLLYVGRIQKAKRLDLLFQAVVSLNNQGVQCNLIIIGEVIDNVNIQAKTDSYKIGEHVWHYGACYKEELLGELIYNADVCVVPGYLGLTAMHSHVYGTPIITHNNFQRQVPEFEAVKKGLTGDFFKEGSVEDLCNKITSWINLPLDRREAVRQECYAIIQKKYNPQAQINTLKKVLAQQ